MRQAWRFVDTGSSEAATNMALDEALLLLHEAGTTPPTVRLYGWRAPTLSIGYAQNAARDVDLPACQACGVQVIRRPTGGRAVLHDQEVTYSVVMSSTPGSGSATPAEAYSLIGTALAAALQRLGVAVHLARPQRRRSPRPAASSPACFAALSRYELSVVGRKIVGSAQKRLKQTLLQHGSIPLWLDRQRLFRCLRLSPERRASLVAAAYTTMAGVNECVLPPLTVTALRAALHQGFAAVLGVDLQETPLCADEWALTRHLRETKYATATWNIEGPAVWRHQPLPDVLSG